MQCRWHISRGAFTDARPLKSQSCWVRGGGTLAHTCIAEEGTPVHPPASTGRVDPANPGVKADQRKAQRAGFHHILLAFEKRIIYWFCWGGGRGGIRIWHNTKEERFLRAFLCWDSLARIWGKSLRKLLKLSRLFSDMRKKRWTMKKWSKHAG